MLSYFKIKTRTSAFAWPLPTFGEDEKEPFDAIYCLYKIKQSHWLYQRLRTKELWLVQENYATVKLAPENLRLQHWRLFDSSFEQDA